jgi:DNA processing protein
LKRKDWLFGLKEISGLGYETVSKLLKHEDQLGDITAMEAGDLMKLGISRRRAERISSTLSEEFVAERYERYAKAGIHVIVYGDEEYPPLLTEIPYHPYVLYVKGNVSLLTHPSIAVVGTRRATVYGKRATRRIVSELCTFGFGIVSGMARGIDTEAHRTSLAERAPSIAVVGTGLDVVYPRENMALMEQLSAEGAVVSEWPLHTGVRSGMFYIRNRIISGLTLGTLVVEADLHSGAMITAEYAAGQHRELFAVPGSIFSEQSRGTLDLIRGLKAKVAASGSDIAREYEYIFRRLDHTNYKKESASSLTDDERLVLAHLSEGEATIDELLIKTNLPFGHLHTVLLSLTIKKQIQKCPGATYVCIQ